jgi:hypothetical protein
VIQFSVTVLESVNNERFVNLTDRRKLETTKAETVRPVPENRDADESGTRDRGKP